MSIGMFEAEVETYNDVVIAEPYAGIGEFKEFLKQLIEDGFRIIYLDLSRFSSISLSQIQAIAEAIRILKMNERSLEVCCTKAKVTKMIKELLGDDFPILDRIPFRS